MTLHRIAMLLALVLSTAQGGQTVVAIRGQAGRQNLTNMF